MRTILTVLGISILVSGAGVPLAGQAAVPSAAPSAAPASPVAPRQATTSTAGDTASQVPEGLQRLVSLDLRDVPLGDALKEIDRQAELGLAYTPRVVPVNRRVTIRATRITAGAALERVLEGTGVRVSVTPDGAVTLLRDRSAADPDEPQATGHVIGWVRDTAGRPIAGADVSLRGTTFRALTGDSGQYVLRDVPSGPQVLVVRLIGYVPVTRAIVVPENDVIRVDVAMTPTVTRLAEVVTTATGQRRRIELGNDIVVLNVDSIARTQPVTSVTQLLEARVPGLVVQQTSGAPGDPRRLRLRGLSSSYRSNDPIVIVDGVQVYSAQSDARNANLASPTTVAAPSPLDQIDPNAIETIEVLKGPSAATLYGADAANGVIVITTKRGRAGPTTWSFSAERGLTETRGRYPENYFRWGHGYIDQTPRWCPVIDPTCVADSLVRYQVLNDPAYTMLGNGHRTAFTGSVSGGSAALQYALTGSFAEEQGILRLPDMARQAFETAQGNPVPDWMRRPNGYTQFNGTARVTAQLSRTADVALSTTLAESEQRRSSLERQLGDFMYLYVEPTTGVFREASHVSQAGHVGYHVVTTDPLQGFYERVTANTTTFGSSLSLNWRPFAWLTTSSDVGLQQMNRKDEALLPRGYATGLDSIGYFFRGTGLATTTTVNLRATATVPRLLGATLRFSAGFNYRTTRTADTRIGGRDIPYGATSPTQAVALNDKPTDNRSETTTLGWYLEPAINYKRLFVSTALRLDGGNAFRTERALIGFPKMSASYVISEEPFFPFKSLFNQLQLRLAYGQAGVQPGPVDHLRLYGARVRALVDSQAVDVAMLRSLGNAELRPERSTELEGGLTASLLDDRLWVSATGYRKTQKDALMQFPVAPSVYGMNVSILRNVGVIRNTGFEVSVGGELVRSDALTWTANVGISGNRNRVVSLGPGVDPFNLESGGTLSRVQAGYPLFGIWARPIVGYADVDGDGIIEATEVVVGDSAVYLGQGRPTFEGAFFTGVSLFHGALRIDAGFHYQHGQTQINATLTGRNAALRALNDPEADPAELAGLIALSSTMNAVGATTQYGAIQRVSTLRFNSLSISYALPTVWARQLGARAGAISLQGSNLALFSNYRGMDPNVNAYPTGNGVLDDGQLAAPRQWQVRVNLQY